MLKVQVNPRDLKKFQNKLKVLQPKERGSALFKGMQDASFHILKELQDNISGKILNVGWRDGGSLKQSMQTKVTKKGKGLRAIIGSGVGRGKRLPYAEIHETGGTITGNPWLRFMTKDKKWHTVHQVKIPARKYMSKTLKQSCNKALDIMIKRVNTEVDKK